jgi:threonine dehydratase
MGAAFALLDELVADGMTLVHPFDDPTVLAGQGTVGLELAEDAPPLTDVLVSIGGGGLISGVAAALKETRPSVRVYGVEPEASNAVSLALDRDEIVPISPVSVADGLGAPFAGEWTVPLVRRYVDEIVLLDDPTILGGLRFAAERMKQVLEPAGAAALAAVLYGALPLNDGDRVCVVASGGNVDITRLGELIAGAAPLPVAAPA